MTSQTTAEFVETLDHHDLEASFDSKDDGTSIGRFDQYRAVALAAIEAWERRRPAVEPGPVGDVEAVARAIFARRRDHMTLGQVNHEWRGMSPAGRIGFENDARAAIATHNARLAARLTSHDAKMVCDAWLVDMDGSAAGYGSYWRLLTALSRYLFAPAAQPEQPTTLPIDGAPRGAGRVAGAAADLAALQEAVFNAHTRVSLCKGHGQLNDNAATIDRVACMEEMARPEAWRRAGAPASRAPTPMPSLDREALLRRFLDTRVAARMAGSDDADDDAIVTIATEVAEAAFAAVLSLDGIGVRGAVAEARKALRLPHPDLDGCRETEESRRMDEERNRTEQAEAQAAKLSGELASERAANESQAREIATWEENYAATLTERDAAQSELRTIRDALPPDLWSHSYLPTPVTMLVGQRDEARAERDAATMRAEEAGVALATERRDMERAVTVLRPYAGMVGMSDTSSLMDIACEVVLTADRMQADALRSRVPETCRHRSPNGRRCELPATHPAATIHASGAGEVWWPDAAGASVVPAALAPAQVAAKPTMRATSKCRHCGGHVMQDDGGSWSHRDAYTGPTHGAEPAAVAEAGEVPRIVDESWLREWPEPRATVSGWKVETEWLDAIQRKVDWLIEEASVRQVQARDAGRWSK